MAQSYQEDNIMLKSKISILLIISFSIFFLLRTQCLANENSFSTSLNSAESYLVQSAIKHAKHRYGIDILITGELLHSQVAPWDSKFLTAKKWIDHVFKSYDKIVFYNDQGEIKSINIVGVKNSRGVLAQNGQPPRAPQTRPLAPESGELSPIPPGAIIFSNPTADSPQDGEGFTIHQQTEDQELPDGVTIYHTNDTNENADALAAAGVILPNLQDRNVEYR